jgi:polysaccharide biosynthesis transport protein
VESNLIFFDINAWRGIIRRRKILFLSVFSIGFLFSILLALFLPKIFVSKATILIEQKLSPDYVKTASPGSVEDRLQTIRQQMLSREKLLEIIEQFDLYPTMRDRTDKEEVVKKLQEDISLRTIHADEITGKSRGRLDTVAFTLSYESKDAATAQKVASILASLFLEKNLQDREQRATKTEAVLQQTVDQMREQTEAYARKLGNFKAAHEGELPESKDFNNQQISRLTTTLDQADASLRILQDRRVYLQGQLATIDPGGAEGGDSASVNPRIRLQRLRKELVNLRTKYSEKHPDVIRTKRQIEELESRTATSDDYTKKSKKLEELKNKHSGLKTSLGPEHPDVIKLSEEINALSQELARRKDERGSIDMTGGDFENPAYANLRSQLNTTEIEIKNINEQKIGTRRNIDSFLRKNERSSILEPEYKKLSQDYENARKKYDEMMNKLMEAKVAKGVEETQQIEKFSIVEHAQVPEKPEKPKRGLIVLVGFFLSFATGVFASIIRDNFDHSIKSVDELQQLTNVPVLSVLPYILNEKEEDQKRKSDERWNRLERHMGKFVKVFSTSQDKLNKWKSGSTAKKSN